MSNVERRLEHNTLPQRSDEHLEECCAQLIAIIAAGSIISLVHHYLGWVKESFALSPET